MIQFLPGMKNQIYLFSHGLHKHVDFSPVVSHQKTGLNEDLVRVFYNDDNWERYRRAEQLAKEKNVETIQISLAYVLNQSFPTAAIIGPQNQSEMLSCREAS